MKRRSRWTRRRLLPKRRGCLGPEVRGALAKRKRTSRFMLMETGVVEKMVSGIEESEQSASSKGSWRGSDGCEHGCCGLLLPSEHSR